MAHVSGKNGAVYGNSLLIEDCEDAWNEHAEGGCTSATTTGKVGTYAARVTTVTVGADVVMMSEVITKDLTAYDVVICWARNSVGTAITDLKLLLDDTAECASPLETLALPALTANIWKQCFMKLSTPASLGSLISVGLYQDVDLGDGTFDIDDVRALAEIDGIREWSLDYTVDMLETTDFADSGVASYIPGVSRWSGTFSGLKDGTPMSIGSEVYLVLGETDTAYQGWMGKVIVSSVRPGVTHDGLVEYVYDFTGTGALEVPTA